MDDDGDDALKRLIVEAVEKCPDNDLLDLIYRLLSS